MSQIDEAFIQAYAPSQPPANAPGVGAVPVVPQPPLAGLHRGPHIQLHAPPQQPVTPQPPPQSRSQPQAQPPAPTPPVAWAPEPIPTPHFQDIGQNVGQDVGQDVGQVASPVVGDYQTASFVAPAPTAEGVAPVENVPAQGAATARRPLSTFSAPEQRVTTAFDPVFEVDAFRWPKVTDDLLAAHHQLLVPVAEQLLDVSEQGRSLIGMVGTRPNVGCSTVLMCLARLVASVGKSVALVDANFAKASLARDLGLEFQAGWQDVLSGNLPLAECVVKSTQDRMALLPLARQTGSASELLASIQTSVTAGVLRYHYDVVLFNLGSVAEPPQDEAALQIMQHCRLDTSIIVADTERTGIDPLDTLLSLFGQNCLGVIGNTAP